ncbi:MAG: tetratricopeptide repeat protein [Caldilineaceae bacterium]|nr:tetratricopeptide repeat protein [Caldilineaceae bacterium]
MSEAPRQFAAQLRYAIQRAKAVEGKKIGIIQDELGYAIGRQGRTAIEYYLKEHIPPQLADVETLGRELVRRAQLDEAWLESFLRYAGHPAPDTLVAQLFPRAALAPSSAQAGEQLPALPVRATHSALLPMGQLPPPGPLPTGSVMPLSRNPHFVGREQDLLELARALNNGQTAAVSQVGTAAATGLGGIGKTQLASEFVHRYGQFFPGGVFWLSFEVPQAIPTEIAACGGPGAMELRPDFASRSLDEQVRLVQATWQETTPRLLVFDNCELPTLVTRWRPTTGACRVLITSRRGDWDPYLSVSVLALDVLPRVQSVELLRRLAPHADLEALHAIAAEVGDLPLALHLAGSYLHRYRRAITPAQYLAQLRDPRLLQHPSMQGGGFSPTGHIEHVGRTFALSYDRIQLDDSRDALAHQLLIHMACFAPGEPVWYNVLVRTLGLNPDEAADAVRAEDAFARLIELGLIQVEEEKGMRIHRLVAAFVRETIPEAAERGQRAVEEEIYSNLKRTNYEGAPLALLPGEIHMAHVVEAAMAHDEVWAATLSAELGRHFWFASNYEGARTYLQNTLEIRRRKLGTEHIDTADSFYTMGLLLRTVGELEDAYKHLEQALFLREKLLGEYHADTADTLSEMGLILSTMGQEERAVVYLQRALKICEVALGPDHVVTAEVHTNLGASYLYDLDDPVSALHHFEQALHVRQQQLGELHPYTSIVYHNLGRVHTELGNFEVAQSTYEHALALRRQVLGEEHPDTAHTLAMLGVVLGQVDKPAQARQYLEQALSICRKSVGDQHLLTAVCHTELGVFLKSQGEYVAACDHLAQALQIRQLTYGDAPHPTVAQNHDHLGMTFLLRGDLDRAEYHLEKTVEIRRIALGNLHLLTAEGYVHAGQIAEAKGQIERAHPFYQGALNIYEELLGNESPESTTLRNLIMNMPDR